MDIGFYNLVLVPALTLKPSTQTVPRSLACTKKVERLKFVRFCSGFLKNDRSNSFERSEFIIDKWRSSTYGVRLQSYQNSFIFPNYNFECRMDAGSCSGFLMIVLDLVHVQTRSVVRFRALDLQLRQSSMTFLCRSLDLISCLFVC